MPTSSLFLFEPQGLDVYRCSLGSMYVYFSVFVMEDPMGVHGCKIQGSAQIRQGLPTELTGVGPSPWKVLDNNM